MNHGTVEFFPVKSVWSTPKRLRPFGSGLCYRLENEVFLSGIRLIGAWPPISEYCAMNWQFGRGGRGGPASGSAICRPDHEPGPVGNRFRPQTGAVARFGASEPFSLHCGLE